MNENETQALIERPQEPVTLPEPSGPAKTSQDMRVVEVTEALTPAYQRASTLELTEEEIAALMEPFPDSMIEVRSHDGLIYIPHIHISDRFNKVFGPGKWALVRRRDWIDGMTNTVYGEYVLLIKGCFVGESIGGHPYISNNPKQNYSDALESTAGEALRRIAAKRMSCGSQLWNPEFSRRWIAEHTIVVGGKTYKRGAEPKNASQTIQHPRAPQRPAQTASAPPKPVSGANAGTPGRWQDVTIHFGKNKGVPLGALNAKTLAWYRDNWFAKEFPEGSGKFSQADLALRAALDQSRQAEQPQDDDNVPMDYEEVK